MARLFESIKKILIITPKTLNKYLFSRSIENSINELITNIGWCNCNEIYYAHDIEGGLFQLLCRTYPNATRICYGDGLGIYYEKSTRLSRFGSDYYSKNRIIKIINNLYLLIKNIAKYYFQGRIILKEYNPDKAILILPIDDSGKMLSNIPLFVCKRSNVLKLIREITIKIDSFNDYCDNILNEYRNKKKYLLITENYSESNFICLENEIKMYCEIIKSNCLKDSVIFIKTHPGEKFSKISSIAQILSNEYKIISINESFIRYPIEFFEKLLISCDVLCMSFPIISLKYFYNIDVFCPMNRIFIEKWFNKFAWRGIEQQIHFYFNVKMNIKNWKGKGILYSRNINNE
jgi:hypothetical protein